jgi:hypothetical protein
MIGPAGSIAYNLVDDLPGGATPSVPETATVQPSVITPPFRADHVDIDQLCPSPQCGFSSTKEGNDFAQDQQWAKPALVVETALEVWGSG